MATADRDLKMQRLSLRLSERQKLAIVEAAGVTEEDLSSFVLDSALDRAEQVLADRRGFWLSEEKWERFQELLERPTTPLSAKPRLEKLLKTPSVVEG